MEGEPQKKKEKKEKKEKMEKKGIMVEDEGHLNSGKKVEGGSCIQRRSRKDVVCIDKENLSKREIHIYSERFRRKNMANMFSNVISLLPNANLKRDRCMILMELICYIKTLQNKIEEMGNMKQKLLARNPGCYKRNTTTTTTTTTTNNNNNKDANAEVEVNVSGNNLLITVNGEILRGNKQEKEKEKGTCKKMITWSMILETLHELEFEVVTTTLSTAFDSHFLFIHAKILNMSTFKNKEEIKAVLLQLFL